VLLIFLLWTVNTFLIFSNRIHCEFISSSPWSLQTPHWNTTLLLLTFIFFSTKIGHFWNVIVGVRNVQHWKSHLSTFGIFWSADSDYRTCRKTRERRHVASRHVTCLLYESYGGPGKANGITAAHAVACHSRVFGPNIETRAWDERSLPQSLLEYPLEYSPKNNLQYKYASAPGNGTAIKVRPQTDDYLSSGVRCG